MYTIKDLVLRSFPEVVVANRVKVLGITVTPGVGASGTLAFGTEDKEGNFVPIETGMTVAMTSEQYFKWGTDDGYAERCLISNTGADLQ